MYRAHGRPAARTRHAGSNSRRGRFARGAANRNPPAPARSPRALSGSLPETFRHGTAPRRAAVSIVVAVVREHDATYNRDVMRNNNRVTAHVKATAHPKLA
ncbi:hypothetical protein [Burkholderia multivorans]|uniref:hypothetical protein n=1 Tax=Burkholderia multivorans TaxID=87883 RepID=UPI001186000F|nr:hypothetical protein [Burkholderia multivorans]MBY4791921.1 hypothetical protein [Burkholderia multivorans]